MATPEVIEDGVTPLDAANLNKFVSAEGKLNVKVWYAHIRYTGTIWEVDATVDSAGLVSGSLAWDTDHVELTLTGFTAAPPPQVTPGAAGAYPIIRAIVESTTTVSIYFYDASDALQNVESAAMDAHVFLIGA